MFAYSVTNSLVLYLIYYPERKIVEERSQPHYRRSFSFLPARTEEWALSLLIARVVTLHLIICTLVTIVVLTFVGGPEHHGTSSWAAFLGITSVVLATIQYVPQIHRTYKRKVCVIHIRSLMSERRHYRAWRTSTLTRVVSPSLWYC